MKGLIVFYSMYGHVHAMAEAVAEAMRGGRGAEVILRRVPETVPVEILKKSGAYEL
jgi:NAD(P)H dehydrogenase (quinone)